MAIYAGLTIAVLLLVIYVTLFFVIAEVKSAEPLPREESQSE